MNLLGELHLKTDGLGNGLIYFPDVFSLCHCVNTPEFPRAVNSQNICFCRDAHTHWWSISDSQTAKATTTMSSLHTPAHHPTNVSHCLSSTSSFRLLTYRLYMQTKSFAICPFNEWLHLALLFITVVLLSIYISCTVSLYMYNDNKDVLSSIPNKCIWLAALVFHTLLLHFGLLFVK